MAPSSRCRRHHLFGGPLSGPSAGHCSASSEPRDSRRDAQSVRPPSIRSIVQLYLLMGWLCVVVIGPLQQRCPACCFWALAASRTWRGGVFTSMGGCATDTSSSTCSYSREPPATSSLFRRLALAAAPTSRVPTPRSYSQVALPGMKWLARVGARQGVDPLAVAAISSLNERASALVPQRSFIAR
jgi:hypothetical protein